MKIDTAFILAAGFGTRLRPLTNSTPKPLLKVGEQSIIDRIIDQLTQAGITRFVVNCHYLSEQFFEHFKYRNDVTLIYEAEILDSGGGVLNMFNHCTADAALVVNADEYMLSNQPIIQLLANFNFAQMEMLLLLSKQQPGVELDFSLEEDGRITRATAGNNYRFYGLSIMARRAFQNCEPGAFSLRDLWFATHFEPRDYYGIISLEEVIDIGTIGAYQQLCQSVR